jgi:uncharacterized protein (TIGR02145 family)
MVGKIKIWIYSLTIMGFVLILTDNCQNRGTVKDIDGNIYYTVTIGKQVWMKENLKTTKYQNGDPIPNITNSTAWTNLRTGAYCNYSNDKSIATNYGRLYNWYSVIDNRKVCPHGWHVPTLTEWSILATYLGGKNVAGGKLKETGTTHWQNSSSGTTNETNFTALPGGGLINNSMFGGIGSQGYWWSSTEFETYIVWTQYMTNDYIYLNSLLLPKYYGFSIRCLRD